MIVAVTEEQSSFLLLEEISVPFFHEPYQYLYQGKKSSPLRFAVRVNDNERRPAEQPGNNSRPQVAHLHRASLPIESTHQSRNDRAFAGSIGTKNDDFQSEDFLCWSVAQTAVSCGSSLREGEILTPRGTPESARFRGSDLASRLCTRLFMQASQQHNSTERRRRFVKAGKFPSPLMSVSQCHQFCKREIMESGSCQHPFASSPTLGCPRADIPAEEHQPTNIRSHLVNAIQSVQSVPQVLKPPVLMGILRNG